MAYPLTGNAPPASFVISLKSVRRCPVRVGAGLLDRLANDLELEAYSAVVLITDRTVGRLYGARAAAALAGPGRPVWRFTLPDGERAKSLPVVARCWRFLVSRRVDRQGLVCALGGGVVGDTAGMIAAGYLRGLDYLQVPTTLLAQVDSGLGGKVGVNFAGRKNIVGALYQPRAVVCDVALLRSLPPAERRNGLAEVIKYGVAMDPALFRMLERKPDMDFEPTEWEAIVARCGRLKARVVEQDETDRTGRRAILNFGHTVGHALEAAARFKGPRHGEAVAVGMAAAARLSARAGLLDPRAAPRLERLLLKVGLPARCPGVDPASLLAAMRADKKTAGGRVRWVLLKGIGQGLADQALPLPLVRRELERLCREGDVRGCSGAGLTPGRPEKH